MIISAIVAMAQNRTIGRNNEIPWYLPADLKYFKKTTLHHHIIMGRNTFDSIGRPLPLRTNIIITRDPFFIVSGCIVVHSLAEALRFAREHDETEAFIIGGGQIYRQAMPYLDRIYLTRVEAEIEGDIFFPEMNPAEWQLTSEEPHPADDRNAFPYTFQCFERIK
jgi:dihydrofolate reductase